MAGRKSSDKQIGCFFTAAAFGSHNRNNLHKMLGVQLLQRFHGNTMPWPFSFADIYGPQLPRYNPSSHRVGRNTVAFGNLWGGEHTGFCFGRLGTVQLRRL